MKIDFNTLSCPGPGPAANPYPIYDYPYMGQDRC